MTSELIKQVHDRAHTLVGTRRNRFTDKGRDFLTDLLARSKQQAEMRLSEKQRDWFAHLSYKADMGSRRVTRRQGAYTVACFGR
jgi:hypothetical protein